MSNMCVLNSYYQCLTGDITHQITTQFYLLEILTFLIYGVLGDYRMYTHLCTEFPIGLSKCSNISDPQCDIQKISSYIRARRNPHRYETEVEYSAPGGMLYINM